MSLQWFLQYEAACAAACAGAGKGKNAAKLDDKERHRYRKQAFDWLREALRARSSTLEGGGAALRAVVQQSMLEWQKNPHLTSVRDPKELAKLPAAERIAWQQLWADVEKLLQKAKNP